jgi:hypothetical protein
LWLSFASLLRILALSSTGQQRFTTLLLLGLKLLMRWLIDPSLLILPVSQNTKVVKDVWVLATKLAVYVFYGNLFGFKGSAQGRLST